MAYPSSPKKKESKGASNRKVRVATTADPHLDLFAPRASEMHHHVHEPSPQSGATIPKSWVKFIVALFLLPIALILTETFFQALSTSVQHGLLASQPFGCFAVGMIFFGILFYIVPRQILMWPYVFGHEMTHAIWVKIFWGKVADHFHVSLKGGHVVTDRVNTWIALAPYFFPLYSILIVTLYAAASLAADLSHYRWILFLLLGFTLSFHLVFTCLLIAKGQPDLHYGGTFFSLMVIYLINLLIVTVLLLVTGKEISLITLGNDFAANAKALIKTTKLCADQIICLLRALGRS